jgi:hypothetical protein
MIDFRATSRIASIHGHFEDSTMGAVVGELPSSRRGAFYTMPRRSRQMHSAVAGTGSASPRIISPWRSHSTRMEPDLFPRTLHDVRACQGAQVEMSQGGRGKLAFLFAARLNRARVGHAPKKAGASRP